MSSLRSSFISSICCWLIFFLLLLCICHCSPSARRPASYVNPRSSPFQSSRANGVSASSVPADVTYPWVKRVHLVFMTHLDVGYTNFPRNICALYFDSHFPAAINTSLSLRAMGRPEKFIYTTHPWLLKEFFDATAQCTGDTVRTADQIAAVTAAIGRGDFSWHAQPFSSFVPMMNADILAYSLTVAENLDRRFGQPRKTAISQEDTMGTTIAALRTLAAGGVKSLHLGANSDCSSPNAPPAFVWRDVSTQPPTDILGFVYNRPSGATPCTSAFCSYGGDVMLPDIPVALVYDFVLDNGPPQDVARVLDVYARISSTYPNAEIVASSLDAFAEDISAYSSQLPIVTAEMGDGWIYGIAADPWRLAAFRQILRLLPTLPQTQELDDYRFRLLKICEHNWGLSQAGYLPDDLYEHNYDNENFQVQYSKPESSYHLLEQGWEAMRAFLTPSTNASQTLQDDIATALQELQPTPPNVSGMRVIWSDKQTGLNPVIVTTADLEIGVNVSSGAIAWLVDRHSGRQWANSSNQLFSYTYSSFDLDDFNQWNAGYNGVVPSWDFGKPGLQVKDSTHGDWPQTVSAVYASADNSSIIVALLGNTSAVQKIGAPQNLYLSFTFSWSSTGGGQVSISAELQWFNKTLTRLPEAQWLSFQPASLPAQTADCYWSFDVLQNLRINPLHILAGSGVSRHLISQFDGVYFYAPDDNTVIELQSLDAALVAPGGRDSLLVWDDSFADCNGGVHFNLQNNLWNTAFQTFYNQDAKFRFNLNLRGPTMHTHDDTNINIAQA